MSSKVCVFIFGAKNTKIEQCENFLLYSTKLATMLKSPNVCNLHNSCPVLCVILGKTRTIFVNTIFGFKIFLLLDKARKFSLCAIVYTAFQATVFIAPYGKQPLENKGRVKGRVQQCKKKLLSLLLVEGFNAEHIGSAYFL